MSAYSARCLFLELVRHVLEITLKLGGTFTRRQFSYDVSYFSQLPFVVDTVCELGTNCTALDDERSSKTSLNLKKKSERYSQIMITHAGVVVCGNVVLLCADRIEMEHSERTQVLIVHLLVLGVKF
jgi:hypothetical protein